MILYCNIPKVECMINRVGLLDYSVLGPSDFLNFCRGVESSLTEAGALDILPETVVFRNVLQVYDDCIPRSSAAIRTEEDTAVQDAFRSRFYTHARRSLEAALLLLFGRLQSLAGVLAEADNVLSGIGRWNSYYATRFSCRKK